MGVFADLDRIGIPKKLFAQKGHFYELVQQSGVDHNTLQ